MHCPLPKQLAFELPLNKLDNREEKWPLAPSCQLLKTPRTQKYGCFLCCGASSIKDEERGEGGCSPNIGLPVPLQPEPAAASLSPGLPAAPVPSPWLMALLRLSSPSLLPVIHLPTGHPSSPALLGNKCLGLLFPLLAWKLNEPQQTASGVFYRKSQLVASARGMQKAACQEGCSELRALQPRLLPSRLGNYSAFSRPAGGGRLHPRCRGGGPRFAMCSEDPCRHGGRGG